MHREKKEERRTSLKLNKIERRLQRKIIMNVMWVGHAHESNRYGVKFDCSRCDRMSMLNQICHTFYYYPWRSSIFAIDSRGKYQIPFHSIVYTFVLYRKKRKVFLDFCLILFIENEYWLEINAKTFLWTKRLSDLIVQPIIGKLSSQK